MRTGWFEGTWTADPEGVKVRGSELEVRAKEGSDFWLGTYYGFEHQDGHALLSPWDRETESVEVSFRTNTLSELYDQAGLMIWASRTCWIKAGTEVSDGMLHVGAVVTNGRSDWSLAPVPEWAGRVVTIRASYLRGAVIVRARADGNPWRTLRLAPFAGSGHVAAGPYACAPTRAGLHVTFTGWETGPRDEDDHTAP